MLTTSAEYDSAVVATVRKPKGRVTITWSDPYIDLGINTTAVSENRASWTDQVADLIEGTPRKWFILGQGIDLSGDYYPIPGTRDEALDNQVGWIGQQASGASGYFLSPEVLTITFPDRPVTQLLVVGDNSYGEYPVDFEVRVWKDSTLLHLETVAGNADIRWTADITSSNIRAADRIQLVVSRWSETDRVVKITEAFTSLVTVHDGDDIISFNLMEESEVDNGSIPIGNVTANELTLSLQNIEDDFFPGNESSLYHTLMKRNRKIEPEAGIVLPDESIEWHPLGTFWSGDWSTPDQGNAASTTARDRMELLRKLTYISGEVLYNLTLAEIAEIILESARLEMPDMEYTIDPNFGARSLPYAWFKKTSHMEALKQTVEAGLGRAYADRNGVVRIEAFDLSDTDTDVTLQEDDYFTKANPADTDKVANLIEVATQPLLPGADTEEVYSQQETVELSNGESYTVVAKYRDPPVIDAEAEAYTIDSEGDLDIEIAVTDATYYAWGAEVTFENTSSATADCKVVINGIPLSVQGSEIVTAEDADSQNEFGILRFEYEDNHLVQTRDIAQDIADALLDSYKDSRKDTSIEWRTNPAVEISDVMDAPLYVQGSQVKKRATYRVFRNKISFDGTLRGSIEGRKLSEYEVKTIYQGTNSLSDTQWQGTNDTNDTQLQDGATEL